MVLYRWRSPAPIMADTTTIEVKDETWKQLNMRKDRGDSFDDVIQRLLENDEDG